MMIPRSRMKWSSCLLIVAIVTCTSGCATIGSRNLRETVAVVSRPSLAETDVRFILELRHGRTEIALADVDAFLSGDGSSRLSWGVKADLKRKRGKLDKTLGEAAAGPSREIVLARPDPGRPFADNNVVLYLRGRDGFHVYFSWSEIDQLFAYPAFSADLVTLQYTHPLFEPDCLDRVKEAVAKRDIETQNLALSESKLASLKSQAAAGVLERKLRAFGVALGDGDLLLTSGMFGRTRSPKLTKALADQTVLERVVSCGDADAIRALVYLIHANAIELSSL